MRVVKIFGHISDRFLQIDCEKKRQEMQDRLNGSTKTPIEIVVDYDNIQKISNPTVISNDIKEPGCCGVLVAFEGNAFLGVVIAIEDLCRDDMTKEAISEQIKKIVLHAGTFFSKNDF